VIYQPEGEAALPEITLRAIIVGVSDYAGGDQIDLRYAAKDAEDIAKAVELGADRLFGAKHVRATSQASASEQPTKTNIKSAFEVLADAKPDDRLGFYIDKIGYR
jgi:hypothetical protein